MTDKAPARLVHLRAADVSLLLHLDPGRMPTVLHWGDDLGALAESELATIAKILTPQRLAGDVDAPRLVGLIPLAADGWTGAPGIEGHRDGRAFSPSFGLESWELDGDADATTGVVLRCVDEAVGMRLLIEMKFSRSGLLAHRLTVQSTAPGYYYLERAEIALPIPAVADEVFDLTGRWARERSPQRHRLTHGRYTRESRKGRPGADAATLLAVGELGFGFRAGRLWATHVAWSGNTRMSVERSPRGETVVSGGELILPGEVRLAESGEYVGPWVYAASGEGLDAISRRFHDRVREGRRSLDRPVVLNTWEAVYFDHTLERHLALAEVAVTIGVERYVLDDGWFEGRRSDATSLGDWRVDREVWPDGLGPLAARVRELGMDFGLWVEPEMVSADSVLAREHPEWILRPDGRDPIESRGQQVLDLADSGAFSYVLARLDELITTLGIAYLKWDHNRDVLEPGDPSTGRPVLHAHTVAVYRLMDELIARHPGLEIENCASGAARLDLAMLERTVRIWPSDCIDPLERARIQQYSGLIAPLEMVGAHIGSSRSHTTGRWADIDFAGGIALLGSLGIECDLTAASPSDLERLAFWIGLYKRERRLIRTGVVVNSDGADDSVLVRGVVSSGGARALFCIAQLVTSVGPSAGRVTFPGLDGASLYRVTVESPRDSLKGPALSAAAWTVDPSLELSGRVLGTVGIPAPVMFPQQALIVLLQRVG